MSLLQVPVADLDPTRWPAAIAVLRHDDMERFYAANPGAPVLEQLKRLDQEAWIWMYRVWSGWRPRCVHCGIEITLETALRFGQHALLCLLSDECQENAAWPWFGAWRARANAAIDALERRFGGLG